ncbi:MAG TPA: SUMF1/EgtB/PvdO family nonheme iron enzyme [Kofleriaceae bacterium]|nr:SUMF1/EgtB/PvdO family nonheme iron enzyme [Kofleriaceae bacterium]
MWEARDTASQTISARSLAAIGGVRGALAGHADRVLDALLPAQRAAARKLLLRLVTPERMRARRTADELAGLDRGALDALIRGRLVVARGGDEPTFELAHERLIDGWPALAGWLSETAEAAAVHARLAAAVADWNRLARGRDALWSARQLADLAVIPDDELAPDEAAFVRASRRSARRRRDLRRAIAVAIPLALASLYAGARIIARRDIDRHIAAEAERAARSLARARSARQARSELAASAHARFDADDAGQGEVLWHEARQRAGEAEAAYGEAARALEAALLLDTARDDVRRRLAELSYERLELADLEYRGADRAELAARLALYDREGDLVARANAPARLAIDTDPPGARVDLVGGPTRQAAASGRVQTAPGSYVVVARAAGRAEVRLPIVLRAGDDRRIALALPPAEAIPPGLVYVPPGQFLTGSRDEDAIRGFYAAAPMHEAGTGPYLIGRTEVTYGAWIAYLDALDPDERARRVPRVESSLTAQEGGVVELRHTAAGWELHMTPSSVAYVARAGAPIEYRDRAIRQRQDWLAFPVSGISSGDAAAYAAWLDRTGRVPRARLCTEWEWERAARGADGRSYPAGDRLDPDDANIDVTYGQRDGGFGPDEVGAHPASISVFGLLDTSGNVWEITRAVHGGGIVMRGGCFFTKSTDAHLANRAVIPASYRHLHVGFRICADPP